MPAPLTILDICSVNGLEIFACLEGTETRLLQRSCSDLAAQLDETQLIHDLASCGFGTHNSTSLHEAIPSSNCTSCIQVYNAAYNMARLHDQCIKDVLKSLDAYGRTPLYLAVRTSNHTAMKMVLSLGADVDAGSAESGWSPLILACWLQDAVAMEILIGHGANLDHRCNTHCNFTPLTAAAAAQCLPTCRMLLAAGAGGLRAMELMSGSAMTMSRRKDIIDFTRKAMTATNLMEHMALCLSEDVAKKDTLFACLASATNSWIKESAQERRLNTRRISQLVCSICGQLL